MNTCCDFFVTTRQRSCGKVMFSIVSVRHCVHSKGEGAPCDHYPWCIGPHCITPSAHYLTPPRTWDLTVFLPSPTSDIWWPSLKTCSNLFTSGPPPPPVLTWHLVTIEARKASKRPIRILLECFLVYMYIFSWEMYHHVFDWLISYWCTRSETRLFIHYVSFDTGNWLLFIITMFYWCSHFFSGHSLCAARVFVVGCYCSADFMTIVVNNGMFSYHIYCVCRNCLLSKLRLKRNNGNTRRKLYGGTRQKYLRTKYFCPLIFFGGGI